MKQIYKQIIYCYVDETGQDMGSNFFIVTAVITDKKQEPLRSKLKKIESISGVGILKWQKTAFERNKKYPNESGLISGYLQHCVGANLRHTVGPSPVSVIGKITYLF